MRIAQCFSFGFTFPNELSPEGTTECWLHRACTKTPNTLTSFMASCVVLRQPRPYELPNQRCRQRFLRLEMNRPLARFVTFQLFFVCCHRGRVKRKKRAMVGACAETHKHSILSKSRDRVANALFRFRSCSPNRFPKLLKYSALVRR